jgi:hypothetical protein
MSHQRHHYISGIRTACNEVSKEATELSTWHLQQQKKESLRVALLLN